MWVFIILFSAWLKYFKIEIKMHKPKMKPKNLKTMFIILFFAWLKYFKIEIKMHKPKMKPKNNEHLNKLRVSSTKPD